MFSLQKLLLGEWNNKTQKIFVKYMSNEDYEEFLQHSIKAIKL